MAYSTVDMKHGVWIDGFAIDAMITIGGAWLGTLILMPIAMLLWDRFGSCDDEVSLRKVHRTEVPRAGGLVLMVVVIATVGIMVRDFDWSVANLAMVVGSVVVGLTGLGDDLWGLRPKIKLGVQLVVAIAVVVAGVTWPAMTSLIGAWPSHIVTVGFIIVATNGLNVIDGLDGLAGGGALVAACVVFIDGFGTGAQVELTIAGALIGACGGFLLYNRHPARVFMGDGGAYFLGFGLACLLVSLPDHAGRSWSRVAVPGLALAVPLLDVGLACCRRFVKGVSVLMADADHLHHRLLQHGFSHEGAVQSLWLVSAICGSVAIAIGRGWSGWWAWPVAMVMMGLAYLVLRTPTTAANHSPRVKVGWWAQRQQTREIFAGFDRLENELVSLVGVTRWQAATPKLAALLRHVGVSALEVRQTDMLVARGGSRDGAWGWFAMPIPGATDAEVRWHLQTPLPALASEHRLALERSLSLLAGQPRGHRTFTPWGGEDVEALVRRASPISSKKSRAA